MAIYSTTIGVLSRAAGKSSVKHVAYILRTTLKDERTGQTWYNSPTRHGQYVVASGTKLPLNAPPEWNDPAVLWNAVEAFNTANNAQVCRTIRTALPEGFTDAQLIALADTIATNYQCEGMCVTWAIHKNTRVEAARKGTTNPHLHIALTMNPCDENGFSNKGKTGYVVHDADCNEYILTSEELNKHKDEYFKLYRYSNEDGEIEYMTETEAEEADGEWTRVNKYPKKRKLNATDWNNPGNAKRWRKDIELNINDALRLYGFDERVSSESFATLGIDKEPTIHEGAAVRRAEAAHREHCKLTGEVYTPITDRARHNYEVRYRNKQRERQRLRAKPVQERKQTQQQKQREQEQKIKKAADNRERELQHLSQQRKIKRMEKEAAKALKREVVRAAKESDDIGVEAVFAD